ncbi:MAG: glutamate--tRNA ligase [Aquabacterium sp.]
MSTVRTRIAPSPTGFLHLGTARTALFSWAFARHHGGSFILRIEDTDVERSTQEAVDQIIEAMQWLGLDIDEGPFFQMQRLDRYREVIRAMLAAGTAYRCWCTPAELDAMREAQRARGEKPRYDGRWRPEAGKALPAPPDDVRPVVRFRNPVDGEVTWDDLVKGPITIANRELDDLVIARPGDGDDIGVPTYNFCVVVDDLDMDISHVIRGDDHVNNTPRQINILNALLPAGRALPRYGHVPMILGPDGDKLSKRHGAVSVLQYRDAGYLPEGMRNYLARLGWSHGDDELFSHRQLIDWFDGTHLARSPAQWDAAKLNWVNAHHLKQADDPALATAVTVHLPQPARADAALMARRCALLKDRCQTLAELAQWLVMFEQPVVIDPALRAQHLTPAALDALRALQQELDASAWDQAAIAAAMKAVLARLGIKMPQLAVPLRLAVCGRTQTPSIDAVLALFDRAVVLQRLQEVG